MLYDGPGTDPGRHDLTAKAIRLTRLLRALMSDDGEVTGLLPERLGTGPQLPVSPAVPGIPAWRCVVSTFLLHADAEPILQLVQGGKSALLEGGVPELAEGLLGCGAAYAENSGRACHRFVFCLLVHPSLHSQVSPAA